MFNAAQTPQGFYDPTLVHADRNVSEFRGVRTLRSDAESRIIEQSNENMSAAVARAQASQNQNYPPLLLDVEDTTTQDVPRPEHTQSDRSDGAFFRMPKNKRLLDWEKWEVAPVPYPSHSARDGPGPSGVGHNDDVHRAAGYTAGEGSATTPSTAGPRTPRRGQLLQWDTATGDNAPMDRTHEEEETGRGATPSTIRPSGSRRNVYTHAGPNPVTASTVSLATILQEDIEICHAKAIKSIGHNLLSVDTIVYFAYTQAFYTWQPNPLPHVPKSVYLLHPEYRLTPLERFPRLVGTAILADAVVVTQTNAFVGLKVSIGKGDRVSGILYELNEKQLMGLVAMDKIIRESTVRNGRQVNSIRTLGPSNTLWASLDSAAEILDLVSQAESSAAAAAQPANLRAMHRLCKIIVQVKGPGRMMGPCPVLTWA